MATRCLFATSEPSSSPICEICRTLALKHRIDLEARCFDEIETAFLDFDIAIVCVGPSRTEDSLRLLARCTAKTGYPPVLVIGDRLTEPQLTQLIAEGAADFARTPLMPGELIV